MDAGNGKSGAFRLSQVLAYPVVRQGRMPSLFLATFRPMFRLLRRWSAGIPVRSFHSTLSISWNGVHTNDNWVTFPRRHHREEQCESIT
jgi:hypothetical protein